jgi:hypothetical protein
MGWIPLGSGEYLLVSEAIAAVVLVLGVHQARAAVLLVG